MPVEGQLGLGIVITQRVVRPMSRLKRLLRKVTAGKLDIREVNNVTIEGYSGNEIVFSSLDGSREKDKRAEGLRAVSAMGREDNTGLGLSVKIRAQHSRSPS